MLNKQLTLPVGVREQDTFDNFEAGENAALLNLLRSERLFTHPEQRIIYISGEAGSGKTHCLYALCHYAGERQLPCSYLDTRQLPELGTEVLDGLEYASLICVDNVEALKDHPDLQVAVFNLINRVLEMQHGVIVFTGDAGPSALGLGLSDLGSRLAWGLVFRLIPLSDELVAKVLQLRAEQRSIPLSDKVAKYLITHWRRDLVSLMSLLDELDALSLQQKRKLSVPFVKQVISALS